MSWWTDNAPPGYTPPDPPPSLTPGTSPNPTTPGFTPDPGHGTVVPPGTTVPGLNAPTPTSGPPTGGDLKDPVYARKLVDYYASQPGANPSLKNDPTYWVGRITQVGGDQGYWVSRFMQPEGPPEGSGGSGGGAGANPLATNPLPYSQYGGIGSTPSPYVAPTWTGGAAPTAPNLTPFTAPTKADLLASPGYQSRLDAGLQAGNRSAAAQGSVLNGGTQEALAQYGQNYASNEYSNLFGQDLATNQNNNAVTQGNFGNAFQTYQANYGQFQNNAAMGYNAYQANVNNTRNAGLDYWSQLNNLYQTGANLAGGSYKPSNVP